MKKQISNPKEGWKDLALTKKQNATIKGGSFPWVDNPKP